MAWRLLRASGVQPGPGGALASRRADLIARLERIAQGGPIAREIARRERLEELLERRCRASEQYCMPGWIAS